MKNWFYSRVPNIRRATLIFFNPFFSRLRLYFGLDFIINKLEHVQAIKREQVSQNSKLKIEKS